MKNANSILLTGDKGMVKKQVWVLTKGQQKITEVIITLGRQKTKEKVETVVKRQAKRSKHKSKTQSAAVQKG